MHPAASALWTVALLLAPPATAPATSPGVDVSVWRARNIESLNRIDSASSRTMTLLWSLRINPSMVLDEHVDDLRGVVAGIRQATTQPHEARQAERMLEAMRQPEAQRLLVVLAEQSFDDEDDDDGDDKREQPHVSINDI